MACTGSTICTVCTLVWLTVMVVREGVPKEEVREDKESSSTDVAGSKPFNNLSMSLVYVILG